MQLYPSPFSLAPRVTEYLEKTQEDFDFFGGPEIFLWFYQNYNPIPAANPDDDPFFQVNALFSLAKTARNHRDRARFAGIRYVYQSQIDRYHKKAQELLNIILTKHAPQFLTS